MMRLLALLILATPVFASPTFPEVLQVLERNRCLMCHDPTAKINLTSETSIRENQLVVPGFAGQSRLIQSMLRMDDYRMPLGGPYIDENSADLQFLATWVNTLSP